MKTYRALRHDIVRAKQNSNDDEVHHPDEKASQIIKFLPKGENLSIVEYFSGRGNLTKIYKDFGNVEVYDRKYEKTGDSFILFHKHIAEKRKFNVIDLDPYGFPNRFFPDLYLLIDKGYLFITMPKPFVNILNGITQAHLTSYYGEHNPSFDVIVERLALWGICHWRKVTLLDSLDLKSVWRMVFEVEKIKATEYTGVRNR